MGFLERLLNAKEEYRKRFIEQYGFPPPELNGNWCKTIEINERLNAKFSQGMWKRWKEEPRKGKDDENQYGSDSDSLHNDYGKR